MATLTFNDETDFRLAVKSEGSSIELVHLTGQNNDGLAVAYFDLPNNRMTALTFEIEMARSASRDVHLTGPLLAPGYRLPSFLGSPNLTTYNGGNMTVSGPDWDDSPYYVTVSIPSDDPRVGKLIGQLQAAGHRCA
ncbi:MAG: hypothetical protein ACLQVD_14495 [Capsulimonadaceae bacterium]